ncbi:hypothetical protein SAMN06269185_3302 [Natronoarchaeum philippinense]|uniref:Uncharacterized protein n=1 Tax=Natronoarchaeum philippinense TaxID=558529 RepID=A0A285PED8_NATPI|nr:hypothetical protein [Natronoarchaeum philippinense]SNZ18231.1 hypothetical protein SAMN06269185_3302 [Natronoarchaeum philippinense]
MQDICRDARKRLNETARHQAEQFDSVILHNHVAEGVPEDSDLRRLVDLAERSYALAADTDDDEIDTAAFSAGADLNDAATERVNDVVTELVAELDDDAIAAARDERDRFLEDDEDDGREEPTRSEPADFGGGESTGVQDL